MRCSSGPGDSFDFWRISLDFDRNRASKETFARAILAILSLLDFDRTIKPLLPPRADSFSDRCDLWGREEAREGEREGSWRYIYDRDC